MPRLQVVCAECRNMVRGPMGAWWCALHLKDGEITDFITGERNMDPALCWHYNKDGKCSEFEEKSCLAS